MIRLKDQNDLKDLVSKKDKVQCDKAFRVFGKIFEILIEEEKMRVLKQRAIFN